MKMVFLLFRRFFIYLQTVLAHIQKKAYMGEIKLKKGSAYVNNNRKWHALPKLQQLRERGDGKSRSEQYRCRPWKKMRILGRLSYQGAGKGNYRQSRLWRRVIVFFASIPIRCHIQGKNGSYRLDVRGMFVFAWFFYG